MSDFDRIKKSYDLRGIYPKNINEELYEKLGYFFGEYLSGQNIAIGYDARLSSKSLKQALIKGILNTGKNIINLGLCSTDMLTFSTGKYDDIDAGIMITASHNPPEYNGLKICNRYAKPVNIKGISDKIIPFLEKNNLDKLDNKNKQKNIIGKKIEKNIVDDRISHILSFIDPKKTKPLKIVVDAGNGTAGIFVGKLLEKLNCEVIPLYFNPDGNFPNHEANPLKLENTVDLINKVLEEQADLGVAFDGDADRVMICDECGTMLSGTIITALIAENILKKNPGYKIVSNTVCGRIISDIVQKYGGISIKSKVGHVYIKNLMAKDPDILFAGEHSAHYFFKTNRNADSGAIALVHVLELLSQKWNSSSDMRRNYEKYYSKPEINFKTKNIDNIYTKLKNIFSDGKIDENDGLSINYPDWWLNVRPSSNEPLLRLNLEANNENLLNQKLIEVQKIINENL